MPGRWCTGTLVSFVSYWYWKNAQSEKNLDAGGWTLDAGTSATRNTGSVNQRLLRHAHGFQQMIAAFASGYVVPRTAELRLDQPLAPEASF